MPRFAVQAQTPTVGPNLLPRSNMRWARPRCLPRRCIAAHVDCGGETSLEAALGARARARAATASRRQTTSRRRDDGLLHRRAEARGTREPPPGSFPALQRTKAGFKPLEI